jgi:hypothetical protein
MGHKMGGLDVDDLNWERRKYGAWVAYGQSKLVFLLLNRLACFARWVGLRHGLAFSIAGCTVGCFGCLCSVGACLHAQRRLKGFLCDWHAGKLANILFAKELARR